MKTSHLKSASPHGGKILSAVVVSVLMTGCAAGGDLRGLGSLNWFDTAEPDQTIVLPRDPAPLAGGVQVERTIHDAIELSRQKRFSEARQLLADVRIIQDRQSEGYQAISGAMALLALREGDIGAFQRIARNLDASLGHPVRVDNAYVDVISLYRAMNGRNLPVNASGPMKMLRERLIPTKNAEL